jgi:aerobic-type carbon monoxide dehydrogenase small subunit (CoxS/CutS family)
MNLGFIITQSEPNAVPTLLTLKINGEERDVLAPAHKTLLEVLREELNLTGTKHGCELGECGTCTVLVDGDPVLSCLALPVECQRREIKTVEGMAEGGRLHPLQQAFAELGAAQCGYCTPGILLTAEALLVDIPIPTRDEIKHALSGNLCRCTGYTKILDAVELAALRMRRQGEVQPAGRGAAEGEPSDSRKSSRADKGIART